MEVKRIPIDTDHIKIHHDWNGNGGGRENCPECTNGNGKHNIQVYINKSSPTLIHSKESKISDTVATIS